MWSYCREHSWGTFPMLIRRAAYYDGGTVHPVAVGGTVNCSGSHQRVMAYGGDPDADSVPWIEELHCQSSNQSRTISLQATCPSNLLLPSVPLGHCGGATMCAAQPQDCGGVTSQIGEQASMPAPAVNLRLLVPLDMASREPLSTSVSSQKTFRCPESHARRTLTACGSASMSTRAVDSVSAILYCTVTSSLCLHNRSVITSDLIALSPMQHGQLLRSDAQIFLPFLLFKPRIYVADPSLRSLHHPGWRISLPTQN